MSHETYVPKHSSAPVSAPGASSASKPVAGQASRHRAAVATKTFTMPSMPMPQLRMPELRMPAAVAAVPAMFASPQARRIAVASGIAVAATSVAVSTGVAGSTVGSVQLASASSVSGATAAAEIVGSRVPAVSRSLDRLAIASTTKSAALSSSTGAAVTQSADLTPKPVISAPVAPVAAVAPVTSTPVTTSASSGDPKAITIALMPSFGMATSDFSCVDRIWSQESGWNLHAANSSGAYGIPQALPGSKMASAGPDWRNNATTQITWGLGYIKSRYGSPCNALSFKLSHGWY